METKDIIVELRTKKGLSQEALAEKVFVTRQAVSRWETGETVPNTETLKLLSKLFDVSINNLSKYISNFKENPTIVGYSGETSDFQTDKIEMINYQIIANKSGIRNINYENIEFIFSALFCHVECFVTPLTSSSKLSSSSINP